MKSFKRSRGRRLLTLVALVMLVCGTAAAEDVNDVTAKKEVLTPLERRMQKRIDKLEFIDEPIDNVIAMIAKYADLDVIKSPAVEAEVTATLTDVPLEEALSHILAAHGYGYIKGENLIRIVPLSEITEKVERMVSKIYRITYADVGGVAEAVGKFISRDGSISFNQGTSDIIVTDYESRIKALDTFIAQIDRITPQILIEARIYDVTSRDRLDLGIEWEGGRNTEIGDVIGDNPTSGDRRPFGIGQFFADTGKTSTDFAGNFRIGWYSGGIDIDAVIRAQDERSQAKLLANPRILVLDNETALIDIVTEHPYSEQSITGSTITETIKYKIVGVKLQVTPHLTRDEMVRLRIEPSFGVVVRQATFATSDVPVVDKRTVNTTALVRNGHTVVIGGLRKKDVSQQVNKVPLLGDLPLLGGLFRFEGEDTAVNELVVFITPWIVEAPVMTEVEQRAYEATEFPGPEPTPTRSEARREEDKEE
jgi:type IV pilus assembly protein PilQ